MGAVNVSGRSANNWNGRMAANGMIRRIESQELESGREKSVMPEQIRVVTISEPDPDYCRIHHDSLHTPRDPPGIKVDPDIVGSGILRKWVSVPGLQRHYLDPPVNHWRDQWGDALGAPA